MADIKEIDYDQIIVKASQIASAANEMQTNIKDAFTKLTLWERIGLVIHMITL